MSVAAGPSVLARAETLAPGYSVLEHMRRGSHLDVYDVWSEERECRCVAKLPRPDRLRDRRIKRRLLEEGQRLMALSHPHIVRAFEVIRRPQPTVILETLSGETLSHRIERRQRRLPARELIFLGLHLSSAIGYLHSHRLLHLDLKPSNIVCREDGRAVVLDLSIAKRPGYARRAGGTPRYMAPEQFGRGWLSAATDVWGIGVVLFSAAVGLDPFAQAPTDRRRRIRVGEHRRLPTELARLIDRCMDFPAPARPSLAEITSTLRSLAGGEHLPPSGAHRAQQVLET